MSNFSDKWNKLLRLLNETDVSEWYRMTISYWSKDEVVELFGMNPPESEFDNAFSHTAGWPILDQLMYVDQKTYLGDAMLTKVDRASMAVGLEIRVPLLDHRVMQYSAKIANSLKYRHGKGKYILKKLLARYVPRELFERPKMGFAIPLDRWLRKELKAPLLDYLSPDRLSREGLFNTNIVEDTVNEHITGKANHHYRLWPLLMWELWRERWLG
jgi:asparagine synthase (glutamine-hydrolysing)